MKYFVAPTKEQAGTGKLDFCHTDPGEPVVIGSKCDGESPSGGCGCRRAVAGLRSRKATTVAVVADVDLTVEQIGQEDAKGFWLPTAVPDQGVIKEHCEGVQLLAARAQELPIGARVCFKFPGNKLEIFPVGRTGRKWGRA